MTKIKSLTLGIIGVTLLLCTFLSLVYLILAGLSYLVCIGFNIYWTWLTPLGLLGLVMLTGFICNLLGIKK